MISQRTDIEMERAILFLQNPFGESQAENEHSLAVQYLLGHRAEAHQRLIDLLNNNKAENPYSIIEILPLFGLEASVALLENMMVHHAANLGLAAAKALAVHPHQSAKEALVRCLHLPINKMAIACADSLVERGDVSVCPALMAMLDHPDDTVRYHLVQAAGLLGCLPKETLIVIARSDTSVEIRELALQFIKKFTV